MAGICVNYLIFMSETATVKKKKDGREVLRRANGHG